MIATFFGTGLAPVAPGTIGSLATIPLWLLLEALGGVLLVLLAIFASYFGGVWATSEETRGKEDHDPSEIVIDEVAGQLIALLPLSVGLGVSGWPGVLLAFVLFRFFDITKLGPIGWADRLNSPTGVMLDDIIAGIISAITLCFIGIFWV